MSLNNLFKIDCWTGAIIVELVSHTVYDNVASLAPSLRLLPGTAISSCNNRPRPTPMFGTLFQSA